MIRRARTAAAEAQRRDGAPAAEVAALKADEQDRRAMRAVSALMEDLRDPW